MNNHLLDTAKRGHHPHSASSLQSSEACGHYVSRGGTSAAADEGVLCHKAVETRDLTILDTPEQGVLVDRCIDLEDTELAALKALGDSDEEVIVVGERYLPVVADHIEVDEHGVEWRGITGGSCDRIFIKGSLAVVMDWKFGKHEVTPTSSNTQGMTYAAAVMEEWPQVEEVKVIFFHPKIEVDEEGKTCLHPAYTHIFTRAEYDEIALRLRFIISKKKRARREGWASDIPACPKTGLCIYCKHMDDADCPALGKLMVLGGSKHRDIQVPEVFNPMQLVTPEQYRTAYLFANQMELVSKAIKKRVTDAALTEDVQVPGFELTRRRERNLGDASQVKRVLIEGAFLTEEEFDNCANVPITKVESAIKAKALKGKGAIRLREFEEALTEAGLLTMGDGYTYLREVKGDKIAVEEKALSI